MTNQHPSCARALRPWILSGASAAALTLALAAGGPALAQPAAAASGQTTVGEVVVTGSRIARRDYVADSPIVTVQAQALTTASNFNLDDQLKRLPQFTGGTGSAGSGQTATGSLFGNVGAATLNLRNLGDNRNLVLLDGRRLQPSTNSFAVDVNTIPTAIIDDVEVITGGASAVYGSDAIAGVVNFKLKHDFEGLEVDARGGISDRGDYGNEDLSITAGSNFAGGRGNVLAVASYANRDATWLKDIPFYQSAMAAGEGAFAYQFLATGYYEPFSPFDNPNPAVVGAEIGAPAGAITSISGAMALGFNTDHTTLFNRDPISATDPTIYNYHSGVYPDNPLYAINNGVKYNANYHEYATTPLKRWSLFTRGQYEITDNINAYVQGLYTHYSVLTNSMPAPADNFWNATIPFDPATDAPGGGGTHVVPQSLYDILVSRPDPTQPWTFGKSLEYMGPEKVENFNDVFQVTAGLTGTIPGKDWTWDIYGSHGETQIVSKAVSGSPSLARYRTLLNAADYGRGLQRRRGPHLHQRHLAVHRRQRDQRRLHQLPELPHHQHGDPAPGRGRGHPAGSLWALPAGELKFAAGADYRRNTYRSDVDPALQANPETLQPGAPPPAVGSDIIVNFASNSSAGQLHVAEVYGELLVPILKDLPAVESFDLDLAYRYSDYSSAGGASTYKADANWKVTDFLSLRGGYQRAVRAPNVIEAFGSTQPTIVLPGFDPCVNIPGLTASYGNSLGPPSAQQTGVRNLCAALTPGATPGFYAAPYAGQGTPVMVGQVSGNPDLAPEKADTFTLGAVLRPTFDLPAGGRVSASVDYYSISVDGAISYLNADDVYRLCFNADGVSNPGYDPTNAYCSLIKRAPTSSNGVPLIVSTLYENQGGIKTHGLDFQLDYSMNLGPGRLSLNEVMNYLIDYKKSVVPGAPYLDYADSISSTNAYFRWRSLLTAAYAMGPVTVGGRWKHLPSARDSSEVTGCGGSCPPDTSAYDTFDLFGSWDVNSEFQLMAGVDNLANEAPPIVSGIGGNTNPSEYDIVGRTYYVGVKARFK